ncbi:PhoX family protein [Terricaulis sp.]|uniref:PhoX family protein n=1 Tax=Terricaulis sp. TaxID=2768686 RepID=UPI003784C430
MTRHIRDIITSRRALLGGIAGLPLLNLAACATADTAPAASGPTFASVAPTNADTVTVPHGYRWQRLISWGDPLFENLGAFDADGLTRAQQEQRWGQNNDMLALFPAEYAFPWPTDGDRFLLCANHEYADIVLMYPALARPSDVSAAQAEAAYAAVGCSVVAMERDGGAWRIIKDAAPGAGLNRRITPFTPVVFAGPAASHRWIAAAAPAFNRAAAGAEGAAEVHCGTMANCAGGRTPWGTYLTSEENFNYGFYLTDAQAPGVIAAQTDQAWLYASGNFDTPLHSRTRVSPSPAQFDVASVPYGPALYGWVVEIDPYDPAWTPRKRTALGRKKGECANTALTRDGRVVVYMGDDQIDEFIYKFVSNGRFDPNNRTANRDLLDDGQLYAARFNEDGGGDWLPLTVEAANRGVADAPYHAPFADIGDVVIRAREAARLAGATPMDRPEDIEPIVDRMWRGSGTVLVNCTYNRNEEFYRPGNPRRGEAQREHVQQSNAGGHVLRIDEDGGDGAAARFSWDVFALAGDPNAAADFTLPGGVAADVSVTLRGEATISGDRFACPDNLCFDSAQNVWIATDGAPAVFPDCNDGVVVTSTTAERPREVRRFLVAPVGSEVCGPMLALDETAFFCSIQHPGESDVHGTQVEELRWARRQRPPSSFPDGGEAWPRASVVVVTREDGGKVGT